MSRLSRLSFTIGQSPQFGSDPGPLMPAPTPPSRRRLADAIDEAFHIALSRGDVATAEELLNVMQGAYERARIRAPSERRGTDPLIERARQELEAKKASRFRRY